MKIKTFMLLTILIGAFSHNIKANDIDKVATCAGLVVGNASVDYVLGSKQAFNDGIKVAYSAMVPSINGAAALLNYSDQERELADKNFSNNTDKVINAYNDGNYDADLYEEIIGCYRMLGMVLLEPDIQFYLSEYEDIVDAKIEKTSKNLRRLFDGM